MKNYEACYNLALNYPAASCRVSNISPPLMGGDEGEGENKFKNTPTLTLPHQWGGNKRKPQSRASRNSLVYMLSKGRE